MNQSLLFALGGSVCLGIAAQWLAAWLKLPAILLLLAVGLVAGPVTGWLHPQEVLGPLLLQPMVALSVALILFEGGLRLKVSDLRGTGGLVVRLLTIGTVVTLILATLAGRWLAGLSGHVALLVGAILVVTGPTVVGPLLSHVRPRDPVAGILRWEGIVIDPIGATLALLVYELVNSPDPVLTVVMGLLQTLVVGAVVSLIGAAVVYFVLRRHLVVDELQGSVVLMLALGAYLAAQALRADAGLFAVTIMGIVLANLPSINVKPIADFKENLRVVLLAFLFVNLAASLKLGAITAQIGPDVAFTLALILVVRPVAVALSTVGTRLTWAERAFMGWMAPRGIVAASVASVFGLRMATLGDPQADRIVPIIFIVIMGTVLVYGTTAGPMGRLLRVLRPDPQGVMLAGAHGWARALAKTLQSEGISVVLVDTNPENMREARMTGLPTLFGSVLSASLRDQVPADIGRLLALTPNDEVNSLATLHWSEVFGRAHVFQLPPSHQPDRLATGDALHLRGRFCFSQYSELEDTVDIRATHLTESFTWDDFHDLHGDAARALLIIDHGTVSVVNPDMPVPAVGSTVVYSRPAVPEPQPATPVSTTG